MENIKDSFSISQLSLITGLTTRTLRNHLSSGLLQGEKIDGVWQFTAEQVQEFVCHPAIRPSIQAKQNAVVYDFLSENKKTACEACMILDFPGKSKIEITKYFCESISYGDFQNIHFAYDGVASVPRVILRGKTEDLLRLVNGFCKNKEDS